MIIKFKMKIVRRCFNLRTKLMVNINQVRRYTGFIQYKHNITFKQV